MITEKDILLSLDNYHLGPYCQFIDLGNAYSYLIDCRLNLFRNESSNWAIAAERLGYNPRGGTITLEIIYFGNCLVNLEKYNGSYSNYNTFCPLEWDHFKETVDMEDVKPEAKTWKVRGTSIDLLFSEENYLKNGIPMRNGQSGRIAVEEMARQVVCKHRGLFRATDEELYKSIPIDLSRILVLDEWYHRDFTTIIASNVDEATLRLTYALNKDMSAINPDMDYDSFATIFRRQEKANLEFNERQYQENQPSNCETWQLIAKVISTGETSLYRPSLAPNTHWKNWPESGSL